MSLRSLVHDRVDVRQGFSAKLQRPQFKFERGLQARPRTANHQIVDGAFDYLLRFNLQRINPNARDSMWAAEKGVQLIGLGVPAEKGRDVPTVSRDPKRLKAAAYLADAKRQHRAYLQNGQVTDNLLVAAYRLAHMEVAYRAGPERVDWHASGFFSPDDAADLRELLELVDESTFRTSRACILKPDLAASDLVGGAEPDFILDGCLVDVSAAKETRLDVRDFHHLVACYLLLGLGGIRRENGPAEQWPVTSIGIYFARFGQLWKQPVAQILPPARVPEVTKWFVEAVCTGQADRRGLVQGYTGPLASFVK